MSGLMNSFYYGKAGQADFTPEQLPANRVELFFSMLRVRFSAMIGINVLYLLFWIPAIAWTFINMQVMSGTPELNEAGEIIGTIAPSAEELLGYMSTYVLGMALCVIPIAIGTVGVIYVLRNWARDQHSFVMSDFKDSIKSNWKQALAVGVINGLSLPVVYVGFRYYSLMAAQSTFWIIPRTFILILFALWWLSNMLIFPMMVTYEMKFSVLVRNSLMMAVARLPWTLLFGLVPVAVPFLLVWFNIPYAVPVLLVFYVLIGLALTLFIQVSYANSCFDRFLNPRIEGAQVNQGLRDPQYNDDDDDEGEEPDPTLRP